MAIETSADVTVLFDKHEHFHFCGAEHSCREARAQWLFRVPHTQQST